MKEDLEKMGEAGEFSSAEEWQEKTGHIRKRKRKKPSRKKKKSKPGWEGKADSQSRPKQTLSFWIILVCLMIIVSMVVGGFVMMKSTGESISEADVIPSLVVETDTLEDDWFSAYLQESERVGHSFISETNEEERLKLVRNREMVRSHLDQYPEDARKFSVVKMKMMGYGEIDGLGKCAYSVQLSNGNYRVLTVLNTEDGLKVDWDGYARYCSATWDELLSGQAKQAEVRVFVKPGNHAVAPFADASQWMCFQMVSPDDQRLMYVYARAGSYQARELLAAVIKSKRSRQHVTLMIKDLEGSGQRGMFVLDELLAMGWVKP